MVLTDGARDRHDERRADAAIAMARAMVAEAADRDAAAGRRAHARRRRLATLIASPSAAEFTVQLTDEVVRISDPARAARRFQQLVAAADLSDFSAVDRSLLAVGAKVATLAPRLVMPLINRRLRAESAEVILPADDPGLGAHLARRRSEGVRTNVNVLGEAIIGDDEAARRLAMVIERLRRPDVDYVSVKISAICAGINPLAFDDTVERVGERLRPLLRVAASFVPHKFVNLDMEEYRDLDLTVAVFRRLLDEAEFEALSAGIVLQAYLPDVRATASALAEWAVARHRRTGGTIKIRVVKGANLAMETAEAELRNWEAAPYRNKADVDANYKAMLDLLLDPALDEAVRVGVASHNLFDVAWALQLRAEILADGRPDRVEIEMLEGMAPAQAEVVGEHAGSVLLYAPIVATGDFPAAIAYLVRRLDENTSPENFLAHVFELADDPGRFEIEAEKFRAAVRHRHHVDAGSRRRQRRSDGPSPTPLDATFVNAADTDWTSADNRAWAQKYLADLPSLAIDGSTIDEAAVDEHVRIAVAARENWRNLGWLSRAEFINRVGDVFEMHRGRILATMAADAAKTFAEGDPEVSEGVDFARYYARAGAMLDGVTGATAHPLGTVVITPPWNFPFAIPAGGALAALAAGNTVILKPAPETAATAALIVELCHEAGIPGDVLQFVAARDDDAGRRLITHPDVDAVVLTGAFETAQMFHGWRPDLRLHAETSGKNALVVTASADLDHAVADLVRSAFAHAGQKCSAASLAIVEAPLYDDPVFLERVRDAASTLRVGWPDDFAADVGPLIAPPGPALERALTTLDPGESWLLEPECRSDDRRLWAPGIRLGVVPGSWFARTECFGPVLGIVRADDLDHAIDIQNSVDFGLTGGIHALDPIEIETWIERVEAGNLYVNRGITGAIVQRQPFGGWKRSVVGPTAKAGGPNYVATLASWDDAGDRDLDAVAASFEEWMRRVGRAEQDPTGLRCERNVFRYRRLPGGVLVRLGRGVTDRQRRLLDLAVAATGCRAVFSEEVDEPGDELAGRLASLGVDRVRLVRVADAGHDLRRGCHDLGLAVDTADPVSAPEIELPHWLREQAVTITNHRHGRVSHGGGAESSVEVE